MTETDPADPFQGLQVTPARARLDPTWFAVGMLAVLLVAGLSLAWVRDTNAVHTCTARDGITYDAGRHCVLDDGTVVNTR